MDHNEKMNELTPEQKIYVEKVNALLADPETREKMKAIKTTEESFAFLAENGVTFTEAQQKEIRKKMDEMTAVAKTRELTPEELGLAAGGFDGDNAVKGAEIGGGSGALAGGIIGFCMGGPLFLLIGLGVGAVVGGASGAFAGGNYEE